MSPTFIKIAQLLLSLSILIVLHELGHFIPARIFKTRVEKFFLFFDAKFALIKKKIGDTVYGIGWIPLGGYVKISGMVDETTSAGEIASKPEPWEFRSKPTWQRLIILLGGVTVNIIVSFFLYILILSIWGEEKLNKESREQYSIAKEMNVFGFRDGDRVVSVDGKVVDFVDINRYLFFRNVKNIRVKHTDGTREDIKVPDTIGKYILNKAFSPFVPIQTTVVLGVVEGSPAQKIGLKPGDRIVSVNNTQTSTFSGLKEQLDAAKSSEISLTYVSDAEEKAMTSVSLTADKKLGVYFENSIKTTQVRYGFLESIIRGSAYGYWTLHDYVGQLKYIFTTKKGISGIGGFASMGNLFPNVWDWQSFWERTAFLSIMLAVLNVLPIPALDGGHVVFVVYEMITKRKPNDKILGYAQVTGMVLLLSLFLYANGNDVYRYLLNK